MPLKMIMQHFFRQYAQYRGLVVSAMAQGCKVFSGQHTYIIALVLTGVTDDT